MKNQYSLRSIVLEDFTQQRTDMETITKTTNYTLVEEVSNASHMYWVRVWNNENDSFGYRMGYKSDKVGIALVGAPLSNQDMIDRFEKKFKEENVKENKVTSKIIRDAFDSITPSQKAEFEKKMDAHLKWLEDHPDYHENYGKPNSYFLKEVREAGFKPIGITVMMCEETFIFETKEEAKSAWKAFSPEGFWYYLEQWGESRKNYVDEAYNGVEEDAPPVYWLNEKSE